MARRDIRIPVMLSPDEHERLDAAAKRLGIGLSTYMRLKALEVTDDPARAARKRQEDGDG